MTKSYLDWQKEFESKISKGKIAINKFEYDSRLGINRKEFDAFLSNWKKENLEERLIIVMDIETLGLDPRCHMICEVGACFLDLNSGKIDPIFNITCQELNFEIDECAWVFNNSDLTFNDVITAPFLNDFREELQALLDLGYPISAFNQSFDFNFLEARGFQIQNKFWDPMLKLTPIMKIKRYNGDYKWPSVQEAYQYFFNEPYKEKHRALCDAILEAKIIYKTHKLITKSEN